MGADAYLSSYLEVIVPVMKTNPAPKGGHAHPSPTLAGQLFALHHDGTLVKGWPVLLVDEETREAQRKARPDFSEDWASAPSVADIDGDGKDEVVIVGPPPGPTFIISGDGRKIVRPDGFRGASSWSSVPIVDLNGDGVLDLVSGGLVVGADGRPVAGWKP
ncbi:MAG: VCBS repeat-containing protein, partial [Polyangiaceae bacterium]|nr:VCBS repeat-containing protein [Polyangiaceae bacterium]